MIGKKRTRGRIADIAVFAPLVLLPFVWFALGACNALTPASDANYGGYRGPYGTEDPWGGTDVYNYPDYTVYVTGDDRIQCASGGRYQGGGNPGSEASTRSSIESNIASNKAKLKQYEDRTKGCKGAGKTLADFQHEEGCSYARVRELREASNRTTTRAELETAGHALYAEEAKCDKANSRKDHDPCYGPTLASNRSWMNIIRQEISKDEAELSRFNNCMKDRERQARASQPSTGSGVNPGVIIFSNPGLFSPRPPKSRPPAPPHKE